MEYTIKSLVMQYDGAKQEIFNTMGYTGNKNVPCPHESHTDKTPSAKWYDKSNSFYCFGCGKTYDIIDFYEQQLMMDTREAITHLKSKLGITDEVTDEQVQTYHEKQKALTIELEGLYKMFKFRNISPQTLIENEVKNMSEGDKQIFSVSYSGRDKNFFSTQKVNINSLKENMFPEEDLLFNWENIKNEKEIIICFDVVDYLTLYDMGYRNICSKSTKGNGFVRKYYDELSKMKNITLVFGNSVSNATFNEIANRIGRESVKYAEFNNYKTINHARMELPVKEIKDKISDAAYIPLKGINNFDDVDASMVESRFYIETGFKGIDEHLNDLQDSDITIIFGRENEGKTTFLGQIIASIVNQGESVFWYNGEMKVRKLKSWLYAQVIGDNVNDEYYKWKKINKAYEREFHPNTIKALKKWHKNKIFMYNETKMSTSHDDIFNKIQSTYKRYGTKIVIIDNLASILSAKSTGDSNVTETNFIKKLNVIKKKYGIHFILVAHPNKFKRKGEILDTGDISGSKNISNLVDNIMSVMRIYKNDNGKRELGNKTYPEQITLRVDMLKDRGIGKRKSYYFTFDDESKRFEEVVNLFDNSKKPQKIVTNYGWKKYLDDELEFYNGETQKMSRENKNKIVVDN